MMGGSDTRRVSGTVSGPFVIGDTPRSGLACDVRTALPAVVVNRAGRIQWPRTKPKARAQ